MLRVILAATIIVSASCLKAQVLPDNFSLHDVGHLRQRLAMGDDDEEKDSVLQNLIDLYLLYKPDSARYYAQQKVLLARKINSPYRGALSMGYYGYVLGILGNYPQAVDYLLKGLRISEGLANPQKLDFFYDALSDTYTELGDYNHALLYADKFKDNSLRDGDTLKYGWLLTKGVIYERFNQLDSSLFYLQRAYSVDLRKFGKITRGRTILTLGNVYLKKGNYPLALQHYRITIENASSTGHFINLIETCNGLARLYAKTGPLDSAIHYIHEALRLSESTAYSLGKLNALDLLASFYKKQGNRDSTIKYLEASVELRDSLFNQQKEREVQTLSFNEQLRQQESAAAQQQFHNKIKVFGLTGGLILIIAVAGLLYRNNRTKQKAYTQLQKQKGETDLQKTKAEKALKELETTQSQLIQREKMASLGELTAGIAHEIQNPLNFVNNFSETNRELLSELRQAMKLKDYEEAEAIAGDLEKNEEKIGHHGKRADAIVKSLLQHSRINSGQNEATNINALTEEYLHLTYHGLKAKDKAFNTVLETHYDPAVDKIKISVVPQELGAALVNLFNNAFYTLFEKQKLRDNSYRPTVSVSTRAEHGKIEIILRDNGMGIPQKALDKIYQPFFTTKPTGDGTGLGLYLSYNIITQGHGGEIKVTTKEGEYTEFIVSLPIQ